MSFHLAVIALFHCSCLLKKNSWQVLKYYGPAYLTALGTMSSAATLGVALECARKSPILRKEISDVTIPLFANIHLCGSILTETVFVLTVSQMLYGSMPSILQITLFILLLGLFAIGAPGVPGGTVLASLGLIISVLHFNEAGTALLLTILHYRTVSEQLVILPEMGH